MVPKGSWPRRCAGWLKHRLRLRRETQIFAGVNPSSELPPIYHHWSHNYVRLMLLEALGAPNIPEFFTAHVNERMTARGQRHCRIASLGAGDCSFELDLARRLRDVGITATVDCHDIGRAGLTGGQQAAERLGLGSAIVPVVTDVNRWRPKAQYDVILFNQSLHHIVELERVFDTVRQQVDRGTTVLLSDMIGRNGHLRWPEARVEVEAFWAKLPDRYKWNHQLRTQNATFVDHDCSTEGFEGIRAQDILPLLVERFAFERFVAFGNIVDVFVDRGYGPNFALDSATDRAFIDAVHARDEQLIAERRITPTHAIAALGSEARDFPKSRGLTPQDCIRLPDRTHDGALARS